ncbi:LacI family DNA-binding transcriptional regulator [Paenibacillus sp. TAB 01]|uniref:LacI family DNA-binding transcriptional regulator n=1 Tax=Paenibacillus sp. TAB 01 TaxID=3368988 RepID=UPI003750880C
MNIREIARLCGVSTSTVSRILNNKPDVRPETREKVIGIMNQMAFRPTIASHRHETIGVVTPTVAHPEFMGELMNGIMEAAYALGKYLTLIPTHQPDAEDLTHFCRCNGLSGMLVINPPLQSNLPQSLVGHKIPHVIVAASFKDQEVTWVDVDNKGGSGEMINHLLRGGHRRIAIFHHKRHANQCEEDRIGGYIQSLQEHGVALDPSLMHEMTMADEDLTVPIRRMMQQDQPPTAIFCTTHRLTFNVLNHLKLLHIRVPEEISLSGFGDYDVTALMTPALTSVYQPIYDMGKTSVHVLEQLLNAPEYKKQQITLPTRVIVRHSTRTLSVTQ